MGNTFIRCWIQLLFSLLMIHKNAFVFGENGEAIHIPKVSAIQSALTTSLYLHLEKTSLILTPHRTIFGYDNSDAVTECREKIGSLKDIKACLVMKTSSMANSANISDDVVDLAPTLVFQNPNSTNSIIIQFTDIFHSSVWSFLLLFVLLSIILLIGCELTHPFGYGYRRQWNLQNPKKYSMTESVFVILGGLFLKSHARLPVSAGGQILVIFWSAFVICFIFMFIGGLVITVVVNSNAAVASSSIDGLKIYCPQSSTICHLTTRMSTAYYFDGASNALRNGITMRGTYESLLNDILSGNSQKALLTDSMIAKQLVSENKNLVAFRIAPVISSLAFLSNDSETISEINTHFLKQRENGIDLTSEFTVSDTAPCNYLTFLTSILPIRLDATLSVFYLMVAGYGFAVIALICEFIYRTFVAKNVNILVEDIEEEQDQETLIN